MSTSNHRVGDVPELKEGTTKWRDDEIAPGPVTAAATILLLLIATVGDLAAFYIVLAVAFGSSATVTWILAAAFAAMSLAAAHTIGKQIILRRRAEHPLPLFVLIAAGIAWVLLGAIAFGLRATDALHATTSSSGAAFGAATAAGASEWQPWLTAGLFGTLYLLSGLCAMAATILHTHPLTAAKRRAEKAVDAARKEAREAAAALGAASTQLERWMQVFPIEQARFLAAVTDRIAFGDELKNVSRHEQSVLQQNPSATDGITASSPTGQHAVVAPDSIDRGTLNLPEDRPPTAAPAADITAADGVSATPARVHLLPSEPEVPATGTDRKTP